MGLEYMVLTYMGLGFFLGLVAGLADKRKP